MTTGNAEHTRRSPKKRVSASITAENQFTGALNATATQAGSGTDGVELYGEFAVVLSGTWAATVTVQRSSDSGVTWVDVTTGVNSATAVAMTNNGIRTFYEPARNILYRVGVKTGNYTSGTAAVAIQQ